MSWKTKLVSWLRLPESELEVRAKTRAALRRLFVDDIELIEDKTNERTLGGRLAQYLEQEFKNHYRVDPDYNRHHGKTKKLEGKAISVDVVVHLRRQDGTNILAIELKKSGRPDQEDRDDADRLKKMTDKNREPAVERFGYDQGLSVKFFSLSHGRSYARLSWFKNGVEDGSEALYPESGD
jgi:hypothetical protein